MAKTAGKASPTTNAAASATIALVKSSSLPALVQRELERMILTGELAVGAKLNEVALARSLGVSRGPVREAFRALVESGLVRQERNRGVFVRQIDVAEADEIYELRAILEEWVGRRLAQTASADQLKELKMLVERMDRAAAKNDADTWHPLNLEFHDRLVAYAGNTKLLATYRRLVNELNLYRRQTLAQRGALPVFTREHRDVILKIASGNSAAAGKALHDHVAGSRELMHRGRRAARTGPRSRLQ